MSDAPSGNTPAEPVTNKGERGVGPPPIVAPNLQRGLLCDPASGLSFQALFNALPDDPSRVHVAAKRPSFINYSTPALDTALPVYGVAPGNPDNLTINGLTIASPYAMRNFNHGWLARLVVIDWMARHTPTLDWLNLDRVITLPPNRHSGFSTADYLSNSPTDSHYNITLRAIFSTLLMAIEGRLERSCSELGGASVADHFADPTKSFERVLATYGPQGLNPQLLAFSLVTAMGYPEGGLRTIGSDLMYMTEDKTLLFGKSDSYDATFPRYNGGSATGADAAALFKAWAPYFPWQIRETYRAKNGYISVPWSGSIDPIEGHFAHMCPTQSDKVRFVENDAKGARMVYQVMKPGRYLTKFYPTMSGDDVREWQAKADRNAKFYVTETPDQAVHVYSYGPRSCMSGAGAWADNEHPAQVYSHPLSDLAVAYLHKTAGLDGSLYAARAVVWPAKKIYGRIYGDIQRLKHLLEVAGYTAGEFYGAKLAVIEHPTRSNCILMPYIDDCEEAELASDKKTVTLGDGPIFVRETAGYTSLRGRCCVCDGCEEYTDEDDLTDIDGSMVCEDCRNNYNYCERTEAYTREDTHTVYASSSFRSRPRPEYWCQSAIDAYAYLCEGSNEYYANTVPAVEMANGETWSRPHYDGNGGYMAWDGNHYGDGMDGPEERRDMSRTNNTDGPRDDVWSEADRPSLAQQESAI